jgi:tRNA(Ser,Leu) C12 N-acetylase TAN1
MTKHIVSSSTIPAEWFDKFCTDVDAVKLFHVERDALLAELEEARAVTRQLWHLIHRSTDLDELREDAADLIGDISTPL